MEVCLQNIKQIDFRFSELDAELRVNNTKLNELTNLLSSMESVKKNLQDNLNYSEFSASLENLKLEHSAKEAEFKKIDVKGTQNELINLSNTLSEIMDKRASLNGQLTQLTHEIDRNKHQLSTDYKSTIKSCNEQCVLVECLDMIISDLDVYLKNLDA
jgi:chromosome segregation ATPase